MSIQIEQNYFKHPDYDVDKTLTTPIEELSLDDEDDLPELEELVTKSSRIHIEEDEIKALDEGEDTPQKVMLRELESMYDDLSKADMKVVRKHLNSKSMKTTIEKLHADFIKDFSNIPKEDVIYLRCCELLGYMGIPPVIANHDDLF